MPTKPELEKEVSKLKESVIDLQGENVELEKKLEEWKATYRSIQLQFDEETKRASEYYEKMQKLEKKAENKVSVPAGKNKSLSITEHINAALDMANKNQHKRSYNVVASGLRKAQKYA